MPAVRRKSISPVYLFMCGRRIIEEMECISRNGSSLRECLAHQVYSCTSKGLIGNDSKTDYGMVHVCETR